MRFEIDFSFFSLWIKFCSIERDRELLFSIYVSYRPYKRIVSFNGYFLKEDFLDWLLDLEDLFEYENIYYERKVGHALYKLSKYALCWWERVQSNRIWQGKKKIHSWPRMKKMLTIKYYPLDCDELLLYTKQEYFWPRKFTLELFWRTIYSTIKRRLVCWKTFFLEKI